MRNFLIFVRLCILILNWIQLWRNVKPYICFLVSPQLSKVTHTSIRSYCYNVSILINNSFLVAWDQRALGEFHFTLKLSRYWAVVTHQPVMKHQYVNAQRGPVLMSLIPRTPRTQTCEVFLFLVSSHSLLHCRSSQSGNLITTTINYARD